MKNNKQDINDIDEFLLKDWKNRRASRYKVEHLFNKLKKSFKQKQAL
jgi:hypothetical protein